MPFLVILLSGISVRTNVSLPVVWFSSGHSFYYIFFLGSAYLCLFFVELVSQQSLAANSTRTAIGYFLLVYV